MGLLANLFVKLGAQTQDFDHGIAKAATRMKRFGSEMASAGMAMTAAFTLPLVAVGVGAVKAFADFDAAMTASLAIMGDVSKAMREDMVAAAREISKVTTFSATQAGQAYYYLASAGMTAAESVKALPVVAKFAQAGLFDMARATELLADAQSALGLRIRNDAVANMLNMVRVSDVLVKANTLANATVEQFSQALTNKAAAALRIVNKDIEEGVAVLAAFADQGVKGEEAGERLAIVMRDLQRAAIGNRAKFSEVGVAVYDASGKMRNMADIVGDLERALAGMSDEQKKTLLTTMDFQERSVSALLTIIGTSKEIRRYEEELRKAGGTTGDVAKKQLQTFNAQLILLKHGIMGVFSSLGESLVPMLLNVFESLKPLIGAVKWLADAFRQLPSPIQTAVVSSLAFVAVAGPMVVIFGKLYAGIGTLVLAFTKLGGAIGISSLSLLGWGALVPVGLWAIYEGAKAATNALQEHKAVMDQARAVAEKTAGQNKKLAESMEYLERVARSQSPQAMARASELLETQRQSADFAKAMERLRPGAGWAAGYQKAAAASAAAVGTIKTAIDKLAEAFETLNVTSFGELVTNADLATKAYGNVLAAFRKGKADISDVVSAYRSMMMTQDKLDDSFQDFSSHLEGFLPDLLATSLEARSAIDTLTLGLDLTYFATERMKREFENFGLSARAGVTDVAFAMETLKGTGILGAINTMQELGQKSQMELRAIESRAADLYLRLVKLKAPALDIKNAYEAWGEASARAAGLTISHAAKMTSAWKELGREISSAFKHMARGIADIIVEGGKMGKVFVDVAKQIAKAIIEIAIMQGVRELIKALSGVTEHLGAIGKALNEWAGVGTKVAKTAGKTVAEQVVKQAVAGPAASAAGGGGGGGGGLAGILTAAFTGVSAITGVIGMFQQMHRETSLNAIEWNTRKSSLHLEALLGNANQFWPWLVSIHDRLMQVVNSPGIPVWSTPANPVWVAGSAGGGGTVTINIYESKSARETAQEVVSLLKRHGIAPAMA